MWWLLALIALVALVALTAALPRFRRVVGDHEWGLHIRDGRLRGVLEAGAYWLDPWRDQLRLLDRRRRTLVISGQEIVTGDNIGVKISVVVLFEVMRARKEGEAALERTRGETAALRNLANAARLLRDNPELLTLRTLQALERSQGNTFQLPEFHPATPGEGAA